MRWVLIGNEGIHGLRLSRIPFLLKGCPIHSSDPLIERMRMRCNGLAILLIGVVCNGALGQAEVETSRSDAIVSEKDEVELVTDSSVSEAINRRPDLSFANVTIDGEDSRRSLDSISADSVTSVEILKAVTPNQDADSRGGSISLKTRPGYEQKSISTKIGIETTYESLIGELGHEVNFSIGGPLNKARTVGGRLSLGIEKEKEGGDYTSKDWFRRNVDGVSQFALKELKVYDSREWNSTKELSASLDIKASDAFRLFWRGSYRNLSSREDRPHFEYRLNAGDYDAIDADGANVSGVEVERGFHQFQTETELTESSIGGEWERGDLEADFKLTYQDESTSPIDHLNLDFVMSDVDVRYDIENPRFPSVTITNDKGFNNAEAFDFEDFSMRDRWSNETDSIVSSNLKWKNVLGNEHLSMRFGVKSRARDEEVDSETSYYDSYSGAGGFNLAAVLLNDPGNDVLMGNYLLDTKADGPLTKAFVADHFESFRYDERRSRERSDSVSHQVDEQIDAYYGMFDLEVGKWRALVGLRQEDTSISFQSNEVLIGADRLDKDGDGDFDEVVYLGTNPTTGSSDYGHAFPNAHYRYKWNDRTTLIASYTNTIERPEYGDVVPFRQVKLEDREIEEGNPDLRPTLYTNIDLSLDVRVGDDGLVSLELFDRKLDDYIFSRESFISGGIYDGFELQRQENSSNAKLKGASITWSQPIAMPFIGEGLSFNANYVMLDTEIEYPARPGEILPLTRSPDSELKFALNYEREKLFVQLTIEQEDENIYRVARNPEEDRYYGPSSLMDLSLSYKLQDKTRWYLEWKNIKNESFWDLYEGDPSRPTYYRHRPWRVHTGMRFEL